MRWLVTSVRLILIVLAAIPLSLIAIISVPLDRSGRTYFWTGRTWGRFTLFICKVKVSVKEIEGIDRHGNFILVSNHASMFDIPTLMSVFPYVRIIFKKELGYVPIWGWALRWGYHIIVDRKKGTEAVKSLERAASAVKQGGQVLLFAEGTRTRDGKMQSFKRGAFSLAAKSGVPILPITINGSYKILPKGSFDIRPANIEVVIERPIETAGAATRGEELKLMEQVRSVIVQHYTGSES